MERRRADFKRDVCLFCSDVRTCKTEPSPSKPVSVSWFWSHSVQIILESVQDSLRSFGPIRGLYAQQGLDCLQGNPLWSLDVHGRPIRPVDYHDPV